MQHERMVKALEKIGVTVENKGRAYTARKAGCVVCWTIQDWYDRKTKTSTFAKHEAVCVRTPSPYTDAMTDCFCDTYYRTIKEIIYFFTPPSL